MRFKHIIRFYGEPKLKKPKELNGIKQEFSVDYIPKKCKCQVFIEGNNLWIKHRDYFSEPIKYDKNDFGAPLEVLAKKYCNKNKKAKFVYNDAWGDIVGRNEAWICLEDFMIDVKQKHPLELLPEILRQQEQACGFEEYELECSDMSRMYEKIIQKYWDSKKIIN